MTIPIIDCDLTKNAPHTPRARLAGFVIARRAIDKCRASLAGTQGEYLYDSPLDNKLFGFKGITGEQFKAAVEASAHDDEIGAWLLANGTAKTPAEIKTWSDEMEAASPLKDPARRVKFMENCARLMRNPETNTTFDLLEADDRDTFSRKPPPSAGTSLTTILESSPAPVFPTTLHQLRPTSSLTPSNGKRKKRDNIFSKSRDLRENRGARQMKTSRNPRTFIGPAGYPGR